MTENNYFVLEDYTSYTKRFRVMSGGFEDLYDKNQRIRKTVDAELDIQTGGTYLTHNFTIEVREDEAEPDFGNLDDLKYFFELSEPPNNILNFTSHTGDSARVVFDGRMPVKPICVRLTGEYAWYYIPVSLVVVPESQEGSGS